MDAVLRAASIYLFLLVIFRVMGKRPVAEITVFGFVIILIIAETTQQGLSGNDFSVTNSLLLITTLLGLELAFSFLKDWIPRLERWVEGVPTILVQDGRPFERRMKKARVDMADILSAAREKQGLERLDQIKYAVLEQRGGISIIPRSEG